MVRIAARISHGWRASVVWNERAVPWKADYRHAEGNAAAHVKAALVGPAVLVPVAGGKLALGRWQDVWFCEFDGPRTRTLELRLLAG